MDESGQSLVEFAVAFVFIMYLLSGAAELGIALFQYVQLRDAAQEGALYGSMFPHDLVKIEQRIRSSSGSPINLQDDSVSIVVTVTDKNGNVKATDTACEADAMKVQVIYPHRIFMPFMPKLLGMDTIHLNASVTDTVLTPICL
jgi:Flp pilus assembly protein TadG